MPQRVLVYEHCTAMPHSDAALNAQGLAMWRCAVRCLAAAGAAVWTPVAGAPETFAGAVEQVSPTDLPVLLDGCDAALVCAPETDCTLVDLLRQVERAGVRLLGPDGTTASLLADKYRTAKLLGPRGIPTAIDPTQAGRMFGDRPMWVWKPLLGAGCVDTLLGPAGERPPAPLGKGACGWVIQPWIDGMPVSTALIDGDALPPCRQRIALEPMTAGWHRLSFEGTEPMNGSRWRRRVSALTAPLAARLRLPGYCGVDMLLSDAGDRIVEVNPRLTTSVTHYADLLGAGRLGELMLGRRPSMGDQ